VPVDPDWEEGRKLMNTFRHALVFVGTLLGVAFVVCEGVAWLAADAAVVQLDFLYLASACFAVAAISWFISRGRRAEYHRRDAMILVVLAWVITGLVGALPYLITGTCSRFIDAAFESFSGFTTTGASVLSDVEQLPHAVLFWRSLTHFLGGVGILIMFIAILPFAGAGGVQLFSPDMLTAASAVVACLGGVGPGMAAAGPVETYAQFPAIAKLVLIFAMLLGRLEIYCCLALFAPSFWKR
jgi:Trk-type K+ transport system membrane component